MDIGGPGVCLIVFPFSIAFPVFLGAWAISRCRKDRFIVALGALAIFIGFALGIMNVIVISKYSFYYSGAPERMLFVTAMMELLFVPLMIFGGLKVRGAMINNEDWSRSAKWLSISLAAVLIITVVGGNLMPITKIKCQYGFDIRISVNVTGSYYVYLPVPLLGAWNSTDVSEIAYGLRFVDGDGNLSVVDTEYGPALRVSSTDTVTLETGGESESASFYQVSLRNTSHTGYGERFLVFSNQSSPGFMSVEIEVYDECHCCWTYFDLFAEISGNGWGSHKGSLDGICC